MNSDVVYDFVIVGGGTSGLVVATRLSEYSKHNVLVIEAGADHTADPRVQIPALFDTLKDSDLDWKFKSEPQPALGGRAISLNQGKALGGSSAINAFVFVPPTQHLIDSWEELGNENWNWDSLQPFFSKAYTAPPRPDASSSTSNQAATGPVQTSFSGNLADLVRESWIDAFGAEHRLMPDDPFVNPTVGAFSCISSIHPEKKERSYSASAYYLPVRDRENLHVLTDAEVTRIVFDNTKAGLPAHASGVEYKHQGTTSIVYAKKEVILAAGALQSPKILELSGVGDAKLLNQLGIEVVVDLPAVGENLQDHAVASICFEAIDDVDTLDALVRQEPEAVAQAMQEDLISKRDLAYFEIAERTLLASNQPTAAYLVVSGQTPQSNGSLDASSASPLSGKFLTIGAMLSQPLSRGSVHIKSNDHSSLPVIDPKYLSNPIDMELLAQHMLEIEKIASTPSLSKLLKQPLSRGDPASHLTTADEAKQYLRDRVISMWHVGSTCVMLPREKGGVVGTDLKVYGIDNLRVVDASALPTISTANLQSTVYAFAERASDIIKAAWGNVG
ncbi:hypothetical protein NUW58_g871 [Xylaria curta]|uniref:Uncharacterized protein n=1 Tax=Xylaria curta TaxID=42375 RepID=A0ACC1PQJ4_9PEZI|nr:hypothetical protein NUW58_g871 [Xylaria curta]